MLVACSRRSSQTLLLFDELTLGARESRKGARGPSRQGHRDARAWQRHTSIYRVCLLTLLGIASEGFIRSKEYLFIGSFLTLCESKCTKRCLDLLFAVSHGTALYAQSEKGAFTMLASGFTAAPVSKYLLFGIVVSSLLVSINDIKYLFHIQLVPHIWPYKQFWRLLLWQSCYNNSTELLFAVMTMYHLRIIERMWGSRKFAVCPPTSPSDTSTTDMCF